MELSNRITTISPSLTLQITAKAKALKAQGVDVISFGAGEPDFDTPDIIKQKAIEAITGGFTKYTPASGIVDLKKAIVEKFKTENGLTYSEKQIVISCGAKHSLFNIMQVLLNEGDEVVILAPYWLSYAEMVKLAGGKPVCLETKQESSFKVDPAVLEGAITSKTKALILNSPSNPTGAVYDRAELERIAEIAVKHSIHVVSDEIYENLLYDNAKHVSIGSLNDKIKALTITVNGVSKTYAMTGWRIGYLAADEAIAKAIGTLQSHSTSNPTSFAQKGALAAITSARSDVITMVKAFGKRRDLIMSELGKVKNLAPFKPSGAFYVFCDVSQTKLSALDFASRILDEAQVAVIPGEPFGSAKHIRLSFAISEQAITEGVRRIKEWVEKL